MRRKRHKLCSSSTECCSQHGPFSRQASEPRTYGECGILESCYHSNRQSVDLGRSSEETLREIAEAHIRINLLVSEAEGAEAAASAAEQVKCDVTKVYGDFCS